MYRLKKLWVAALIVLFMVHGVLYYLYPDQHYTAASDGIGWISILKYLFILAALPALIPVSFSVEDIYWFVLGCGTIFVVLILQVYWANAGNPLLLQFVFPTLGYFFAPFLVRIFDSPQKIRLSVLLVVTITLVAITAEMSMEGLFTVFSRSGFRGIGPFINPNNTGIVIAVLAAVFHRLERRRAVNVILGLMIAVILVLTGSKTALFIYLVVVLTALGRVWRVPVVLAVGIAIVLSWDNLLHFFSLMELRELSLESGLTRSRNLSELGLILGHVSWSDALFGFSRESMIDNTYLDIFTFGGAFLLAFFVAVQGIAIAFCLVTKRRLMFLLHVLFFLAMLTTNVSRLWPTGYMYWALVGLSLLRPRDRLETTHLRLIGQHLLRRRHV
jgi:hypothetical protein